MLQMITGKDRIARAVLLCDHCHEPITDPTLANAEWEWELEQEQSPIWFVHKKCCVEFEGGRPLAWHSLDLFLMLLLYENGVDDRAQAELKHTIDDWISCGLLGTE
jgi:hypothetical protein